MEVFAPVIALSVIALTLGATFILRGPLGKALADRVAHRASREEGEVERLRADVDDLRGLVGELQERLDFAERMLAQQRERPALPER